MTASELGEHSGYLHDEAKLVAYEQALAALLADGNRTLLDLGAGTGILGLLGARAGARKVYAVDSGPVIGAAAEVAKRSPLGDDIIHLRGRSTDIELPEPVDVAVCDQIGGFVHDAGVLEYFADARQRLLADDGALIPSQFRLYVAPVECTKIREQIELWGASPGGFDFSPFQELAVNTEHGVGADEVRILGPGVLIASIAADHTAPIKGAGHSTVDQEGRCDGLVGWFEADLGGGVTITNHPKAEDRIDRWCNLYPIAEGLDLHPGDTVETHIDIRPLLHVVTWRVAIQASEGDGSVSERHSTLLGQFLAPDELARSKGVPIEAMPLGQILSRAIELADGTRSTDEVIALALGSDTGDAAAISIGDSLRPLLLRFTRPIGDRN